jgi:hypothetical protein
VTLARIVFFFQNQLEGTKADVLLTAKAREVHFKWRFLK